MRIAYLITENLLKHPGLKYKILGQIKRWQENGHEVYQVILAERVIISPEGIVIDSGIKKINVDNKKSKKKILSKLLLIKEMALKYKFAIHALKIIQPDLTYSRYLFPAPKVSEIYKHAGKLVFEINSDDRAEYMQKNKITGIYNYAFRYFSLKNVDALVFVTKELMHSKSFKYFSGQKIVIANGISVNDFHFISKTTNNCPNLVFIGSPGQAWHGLDKIYLLAEILKECTVNIIGPSKEYCVGQWKTLPKNVVFHGYLSAEESKCIIKNMDVGIGTLALYRKKMHEACPLKVRQYLAQGLPVIAASKDTDISENNPFYLKLPNSENNILDYHDVICDFINYAYNNENLRIKSRNFAEEFLSFNKKELIRLDFFYEVIKL